jgi:prephenate dehydratase
MNQEPHMTKYIAFQGTKGAFSDISCRVAAPDYTPYPCFSFADVFAAVQDGTAELAMMPIENSIAGRVADVHQLIPNSGLHAIAEYYQPVEHHLLAVPGATMADIKTVQSHVQALSQCRLWLRERGLTPVVHADTALAAEEVAQKGDKSVAAIASSLAGELYGLTSLAANIADRKNNTTHFLILSRQEQTPPLGTRCITSLLFRVRSVPAALYKTLGGFATNGINITKLESYLVDDRFTAAQFYMDVEGHKDSEPMRHALEELSFFAQEITIIGTYPEHIFRKNRGL